ncbi:MAG: biotin synthase, partial [Oligoflexus sp.]
MLHIEELASGKPRYDYSRADIQAIYDLPMTTLVYLAQSVHRRYYAQDEIQLSTLLSIKTGGCKENCGYCPQSAHYETNVQSHGLLSVDDIIAQAREAKANGSSR